MQVKVNKQFLKDLAKLPPAERHKIEKLVFEESEQAGSIELLGKFEKMTGYKKIYKARFGNYRVGVSYDKGVLVFERVLNRKEIYRYFP